MGFIWIALLGWLLALASPLPPSAPVAVAHPGPVIQHTASAPPVQVGPRHTAINRELIGMATDGTAVDLRCVEKVGPVTNLIYCQERSGWAPTELVGVLTASVTVSCELDRPRPDSVQPTFRDFPIVCLLG